MSSRHTQSVLRTLALKQRIGHDTVYRISFGLLAHLDACKRGHGGTFGANVVTLHILISMLLGNILKDKAMYDNAADAYRRFSKTCGRPDPVSLTTAEYAALKKCLGPYVGKVLPNLEWKQYLSCEAQAFKVLKVSAESQQEFIKHGRPTVTTQPGV